MTTNKENAVKVKKVAPAKKNAPIKEDEVKNFVENRLFELILTSVAAQQWDGKALEEDRVYHLLNLSGIRIYWIKDNRRTWRRALKMLSACKTNGMTTPAVITDAQTVVDWGLPLIDPATLENVSAEKLEGAYAVMEGHGRMFAFILALAIASKTGEAPFDFHFVYKHYDSPENFGKAYISTNADMTRTTSKDRLGIAGARCKNPLVISYLSKIKDDGAISKASYFWTYGRELTKQEVTDITYENEGAPEFDKDLTDGLLLCYEAFKERFGNPGAEKIYRGTPAAQWCADRIGKADDKTGTALIIAEKVKSMKDDLYTPILTASSNKKKHITRDQIIKVTLDMMMKK